MVRGVDGVGGIVRRGLTIVLDRWFTGIVRDTAATGDIVRGTIVRRCRRIVQGTADLGLVSLVMGDRVTVREIVRVE
jgi:hypothetical protein